MESKVSAKGRVTIPKAIRERLGLMPNGKVKFFAHPDGNVVLLPVHPVSTLRGILRSQLGRRLTIEEMDDAIAEGATKPFIGARAGKRR
jgi:AbrB family looped-hinge helix DNA binding protein